MKKRVKNISGGTKLIAGLKVPHNGTIDITLRQINRYLTASMFTSGILEFVGDIPPQVSVGPGCVKTLGIQDKAVTKSKLGDDVNVVEFPGVKNIGVIRLAANVGDTETITIGDNTFEFDTDIEANITKGNIRVDVSGGATPAAASVAFVAAVNKADIGVAAVKISDNEVALFSDGVLDLAETMAGVNNVVDTDTTRDGMAIGTKQFVSVSRVPNDTEVALGNVHIPLNFVPTTVFVQVRATATGIAVAWDGAVTITEGDNPYITLDNSGTTDWATTSTIHVIACG